jgi:hypothetical protein
MKSNKIFILILAFVIGIAFALTTSPDKADADILFSCICPDEGGGAIPPDADEFLSEPPTATSSAKYNANPAPLGACWKDDPKARVAPVSWYWPMYKNVHLQIYDSTGAWWFNGWVKSNSYTVFSKDGKGQFPGIPTDGRTVYAKVSYGGEFSEAGKINCGLR